MPCKYCYCEYQDGYLYCECQCEDWEEGEDPSEYDCGEKCPHYHGVSEWDY